MRETVTAGVMLLALGLWSPSYAAPKKKPPGEAAARIKRAQALYDDGDFNGALTEYKAAQRAEPGWQLLFPIGQCERRLKHYHQAVKSFEHYLEQGADAVPKDKRANANVELTELKAISAQVTIVSPEPVEVSFDGDALGKTPFDGPLYLPPGSHAFAASADGSATLKKTVQLSAGKQFTVDLTPTAQAPEPMMLVVQSWPDGATIAIDGKPAGKAPATVMIEPGQHIVTAELPGHLPYRETMVVGEGQKNVYQVSMEQEAAPPRSRFPVAGVLIGGAGVLALGSAIALGVHAKAQSDEVNALYATGGRWDAYYDQKQVSGENAAGWSALLGVGGGIAIGVGLIVTFVSLGSEPSTEVEVAPEAPVENARLFITPLVGGGAYGGLSFQW